MPLLDGVWIVFLAHHTVSIIIQRGRGSSAGGGGGGVSLWRGVKPTIPAPRALTIDKAFVRDVLCIDARPLNLESCT